MIDALIAGRTVGKPTERTTSAGKPYATAKVRVPTKEGDALLVNVIAFDATVVTAILALSDGDPVSMVGEATPKVWTDKDGNAKPSLSLLAHAVISPFSVKRKRKAAASLSIVGGELPFGDEFPGVARAQQ
jgi:single-stranded DNA-binding protein